MNCPRCDSPAPHLHPAVQCGGEVSPCAHSFHERLTPENTPGKIAETQRLLRTFAAPVEATGKEGGNG